MRNSSGDPARLRHRQREHPRPRDRVFALGLVQREAHRLHTEGRGVLGEQGQDLPLVLRGLQRHGEGADEVHLPGVVEAAARVLPVGALAEGDAGQVEQVLGSLRGRRSRKMTDGASQAGERRVPALGAVASGLDALKELHERRLEGAGRAVRSRSRVRPTSRRRHRSATASGDSLDRARSRAPSMAAVVSSAGASHGSSAGRRARPRPGGGSRRTADERAAWARSTTSTGGLAADAGRGGARPHAGRPRPAGS